MYFKSFYPTRIPSFVELLTCQNFAEKRRSHCFYWFIGNIGDHFNIYDYYVKSRNNVAGDAVVTRTSSILFYFLWDICPYQINNWKTTLPLNFQELNSSPSVERKVKSGSWTRRMSSRVPPPTLPPQDLEAWSLLLLQLQWATSYLLHLRPTSLAIRSVWSRYKRWMRSKWVHASVAFSLNALAILILKRVLIFLVYFEF